MAPEGRVRFPEGTSDEASDAVRRDLGRGGLSLDSLDLVHDVRMLRSKTAVEELRDQLLNPSCLSSGLFRIMAPMVQTA